MTLFNTTFVMPQNLLGKTGTYSRKGPRVPTYNIVLLMYVNMIFKGYFMYIYDEYMNIINIGKHKIDINELAILATMSKRQDTT